MPHSLLRALKYRSTPTLPSPSQQRQQQRQYQQEQPPTPTLPTPSIFVSFPDDEGGGHWCAYAGSSYITTRAILSSLYPSQVPANANLQQEDGAEEPPLPDFAALEETIQKLRRAGETPTFKRPTRADEVVLPKKKAAFGKGVSSQQYQSQRENGIEDWNAVSRRWTQQQARQNSNTGREDGDEDFYGGSPIANHSTSELDGSTTNYSNSQSGRSSPAKFIRGITKTKAKDASKKAPRPLVLQASSSVASSSRHYGDGTEYSTRPASASPTSPEYASEGQWMASQPSATSSDRNIRKSLKRRSSLGWLFSSNRNRRSSLPPGVGAGEETPVMAIIQQYDVPETVEERSAESHESSLNKPLPPLPRSSQEEVAVPVLVSSEAQTEEATAIVSSESTMSSQPERTQTPEQFTTTIQVEKGAPVGGAKLKKKFSLKRLREKFMSPSTTNIPPVPPLPTVVNVNTVSSIDSKPTDMVTSPDEAEPIELVTEMPTSLSASTMDTMVTALSDPSALHDEDMDRSTSSEDSGSGSSATDSSNVAESAASTPYSTPPDTPNSAEGEKAFQVQQDMTIVVVEQIKALVAKEEIISAPVEVLEKDAGLKRSHGMRMNLDAVPTVSC